MTRRERPDPTALVADIPRDSGIPRYTRAEPAAVKFQEPVITPGSVDSLETQDDGTYTAPRKDYWST